jgi:hypothetical protein
MTFLRLGSKAKFFACAEQGGDTQQRKDGGGNRVNQYVSEQHAQGRSDDHQERAGVVSRQCDGRDLGLVTHLSQKERDERGAEHPELPGNMRFFVLDLVRNHRPDGHANERGTQNPTQDSRADSRGDPGTQGTGQTMIDDGRAKDAGDDGEWFFESRRENEGEQLGLVTDFREGDYPRRDEERFHEMFQGRSEDE